MGKAERNNPNNMQGTPRHEEGLQVLYPPSEIFKHKKENIIAPQQSVLKQKTTAFILEKIDCPETGGIFCYYQGVPFPSKCFPFPEAIYAVNLVKRFMREILAFLGTKDNIWMVLGFVLFTRRAKKLRIVGRGLRLFAEVSDRSMKPYYLDNQRYCGLCRELRTFIITFLEDIGVRGVDENGETLVSRFATAFVSLIEYDSAYRLRLGDLFSETTKERLLEQPGKEMMRLVRIVSERDPSGVGSSTVDKFIHGATILKYALWLPSVNRAFKKALNEVNFQNMQFDQADRYHCLLLSDYNFFGLDIETRIQMYKDIHKDNYPPRVEYALP